MVIRLQGFGVGVFGGNFHTHNTIPLPPGLDVVVFSNGSDWAKGWRYAVEAAQQVFRGLGSVLRADQFELVAAVADFQGQALFDQSQVLVELAAEVGEAACFKGFEGEAMRFYGCVQGLSIWP